MNEREKLVPKRRFKEFKNKDAWEQRELKEILKVNSGRDYKHLGSGSIPVYGTGGYMLSVNDKLSDKDAIGIGRKGTIDKPQYLKAPFWTVDTLFFMIPLNNFDLQFLYTMTQKINWKKMDESTGVPSLSKAVIEKVNQNIPSYQEQIKIGGFFLQLDNTIALHQQKQRQIRSLKQGFIKNLFPNNKNSAPRIRFSIFNDDWNQRNASEIFTSVSDKNYPELPVLSASQEKGMVLRESNGIDIKYDQKSTGTYKRVLPGQFVMHLRSFQGGFAYSTIEGITSPAYTILAFRNKEDHYPLFWKSIFSSKNFIKRLEAITYGIRDGRSISYADFSTLRFWIPSYEEQKQIGDFIESIDATIAFYQRQIDMMQSLKKELLNKMFI